MSRFSVQEDLGRGVVTEFVLRVVAVLSGILSIVTAAYLLSDSAEVVSVISLAPFPIFLLAISALNTKSKISNSVLVPAVLVGLFYFFGFITILHWGFDAPQGLLTLALSSILLALLFRGKAILLVFGLTSLIYVLVSSIQTLGIIGVSSSWRKLPGSVIDIVVYASTLLIIFYVTWLFNKRLQHALEVSRQSTKRYRELSEQLDFLVKQRTLALKEEQSRRMADLHQFILYGKEVSGLLHDIINPLTTLSIQIDTLQTSKHDESEVTGLRESIKRLERFVLGARSRMRREVVKHRVSIKHEALEAISTLKHRTYQQEVTIRVIGKCRQIFADSNTIYKVFVNLISNSLDSFHGIKKPNKNVNIILSSSADACLVKIEDNGCGIAKKDLRNVFKPFFTTKSEKHNSGFGLALVKELVEIELSGSINIESTQGKGTIIQLKIPLRNVR